MEMIRGTAHAVFSMEDASRVGEARRHALHVAHEGGFGDTAAGRVAIVVTELGNNLARHARAGRLWIRADGDAGLIEIMAVDEGPGIADVDRSLRDGFSTAGTAGTGLGAVRRLADEFDLHSVPGAGTVVLARLRTEPVATHPAIRHGAVSLAAPGEVVCGDGWAVASEGDRLAAMVADGLGHGPDAARAAREALDVFREEPMAAPRELIVRTHAALRTTRGAAVTVVQLDAAQQQLRSAGVGNVVGRLISGTVDRTLLSQHGTAGVAVRTPDEITHPWPPHALLALCTDGIATRWKPDALMPLLQRDPAMAAALLARDHCRGRDDATVLVLARSA